MIEKFFKNPRVLSQFEETSIGSSIDYLAEYLNRQGHSLSLSRDYLRIAKHFCYWVKTKHIHLSNVNEETVEDFLYNHLKECSCPVAKGGSLSLCRPALKHYLEVLRQHHLIVTPIKTYANSPIENLLYSFGKYLEKVHGATWCTSNLYSRHIKEFLKEKYKDNPLEFKSLDIKDIRLYVAAKSKGYKPKTTKSLVTSLRAFFRYLRVTNQIELPLEDAVPTVISWKLSSIPKYLTEEQLKLLLSSFNLSIPLGLRDHAMSLLMARMGLRACEVAKLSFDDINWRKGVVQIRKSKSRHTYELPLFKEAGKALVAYIQKGRPFTNERAVFVSHALPVGLPLSADAVRAAIRRAFKRCALNVPSYGTHVLRHTLATHLLHKGARLKEIADILRHHSIETTNIYSKVDLNKLAQVALPWPEVEK